MRDATLAEVFLGQDIARDLAPAGRHLDLFGLENQGAIGIADLTRGDAELDLFVNIFARFGEAT